MLIHKTQYRILLSLLLPGFLLTQSLKVEIYGSGHSLRKEIEKRIYEDLAEGKISDEKIKALEEKILNLYIENGFYFARIESVKVDDKLKIYISEGKQAKLGRIEISGNKILSDEDIITISNLKRGDVFLPKVLKSKIDRILDAYSNLGHPLAEVEIVSVDINEDALVNLKLRINEREPMRIEEIVIEGNRFTKESLILREVKVRKGELYREAKIKQIRSRLLKLGLFEVVEEPEIFISDTTVGILIKVKEARPNFFDGIVGYVPETETSKGYFTGYINVMLRNLLGTGRRFGAKWSSESKETQEFELNYFEPYVLNSPLSAEFLFHQRKQDSVYVVREPSLNFSVELSSSDKVSEILKASFYFVRRIVIPTATEFLGYQIFESTTLKAGFGILYDSRDNLRFPRSGIYFSSFYEVGHKSIVGTEEVLTFGVKRRNNISKFRVALDFYFNFKKILNSVFVPRFNAIVIYGDGIDESDAFRFGGMRTLRGYREREFLATRVVWLNLENRLLVSEEIDMFLFFDVGYVYRPVILPRVTTSFEAIKYGYGVGTRFKTTVGKFTIVFALGQKDSFKTGKIHFGIESEF